jgi:hypothetical protein
MLWKGLEQVRIMLMHMSKIALARQQTAKHANRQKMRDLSRNYAHGHGCVCRDT